MDAYGIAAFTSTANMVLRKSTVDPMWARIDLHMIVEALHHGLSELALPQKQAQISDVYFWLDLTKRAAEICGIPYGTKYQRVTTRNDVFVRENPRNQAPPAQVSDRKTSKNTTKQAVTTNTANHEDGEQGDASDAISDTSFTPPKNFWKSARIDEDGRRHVILPPGIADRAPKQRFIREDKNGQRKLLAPPGFHNLPHELISKPEPEPEKLSFERKQCFEKTAVKYGGISLTMMREQPSRFEKMKKSRSSEK
ncbi:hypothetical protein E0Z10_g5534 [Xylaria hypoxylon]|uniref:Uncharacterized protein n=1 Tax=Xylaria hypoxylon TaxID=37992 RepID=A0A4Z0YUZ2_9PEZI|nr:hypothetical protein E0Z10_g5534 [Xylaria hypoxylon]